VLKPEILARKWGIGSNTASRTVDVKVYAFESFACAEAQLMSNSETQCVQEAQHVSYLEFEAAWSKEPRRGLKAWRQSKQAQKTEKWNVSLSNEVFGV
jgi:hypothetical protein